MEERLLNGLKVAVGVSGIALGGVDEMETLVQRLLCLLVSSLTSQEGAPCQAAFGQNQVAVWMSGSHGNGGVAPLFASVERLLSGLCLAHMGQVTPLNAVQVQEILANSRFVRLPVAI